MTERCKWAGSDPLYIEYHDNEWGRPHHDDHHLFEMLILEGAQAGLSWLTILKRRDHYRQAFDRFDPDIVRQYDEAKIQDLMNDEGIIRNERKIRSAVKNAEAFRRIQSEFGSFDAYIWQFVNGEPILNDWPTHEDVPAYIETSATMSKDLKKRGFSFVGPTICYAFMQATGMVNDHTMDCFLFHGRND